MKKETQEKENIKRIKSKKLILTGILLVLAIFAVYIATNQEVMKSIAQNMGIGLQNAEEGEKIQVFDDGSATLTDDSAIVTSASITGRVTGTGPFDENDEPGNDSSAENSVVRSFDKVTWKIEANIGLNNTEHGSEDANTYSKFRGGIINIEATIPAENAGVMKWSLEDMTWAKETGVVSEDGLTFTAQYKMSENEITVPGKQNLELVLQVYGAGNGTELDPTFRLWMQGNESNKENQDYEAIEIVDSGEKVKVSAKGRFNINLVANEHCEAKANVDFGQGEKSGRVYGCGVIIQLANENEEKGLKGLEYPKGDINFDIKLKVESEETIDGKKVTTDITEQVNPQLWNYKISIGSNVVNPSYGNIPDRNMYFGKNTAWTTGYAPYGMADKDRVTSIYNSGNIYMEQENNIIKTTINNYEFDGIFPEYSRARTIKYTKNIGCFSAGYFQVFVPDDDIMKDESKKHYFIIEDENISLTTNSGEKIVSQINLNDDKVRKIHYLLKPGIYYQNITLMDKYDKELNSEFGASCAANGLGRKSQGQTFQVKINIGQYESNDMGTEIRSVNKLLKFDGDGLEPVLQNNGNKVYLNNRDSEIEYKMWYLTKKDGTNWISQDERNNANIEDLNIYETLEAIPKEYICIGVYMEIDTITISKDIPLIFIAFRIKDTAKIGKTYGIVHESDCWIEKLDRTTQTITNPDATYPKIVFSAGHKYPYKNTEYDENGEKITETHQSYLYGNSVLVVGAESSVKPSTINPETQEEKTIYDLGKNENEVTFKVEPKLEELDENNPVGVTGATVTIKDTLPKGLTYVPGSSNYGEPIERIENEDGSVTLKFEKYNCNVGEEIESLIFKATIDPRTANETVYTNTAIIEPDREKIGLSEISYRTATSQITVINLGSQRLYTETDTQIIENDGEIRYKLSYQTNSKTPDFQLIDVLPYNGDGRGTGYNGTYTVENINIKQEGESGVIDNSNIKLYTTTDIEARKISPKDEGIGVEDIWTEKQIGETISEPVTVIGVKGEIPANTTVEVEIVLKTNNNKAGDKYANSATAQTSKDTEVIATTNVETKVVKREITGMIWYDTNENGIKDTEEGYANRIEVELKKADGSKAEDVNGNEIQNVLTNEEGKYTFSNLPKGEYIVKINTESKYKLTQENEGTNQEINSKFTENETGEKQSYTITNLNSIESPEIIEKNVNAGLIVKDAKIIVKYLEEDGTPETDEDNKVLKEQTEITGKKLEDSYEVVGEEIENYISLRNSGNTSGVLNSEEIVVTYYYTYNKQNITIEKEWKDNNNQAGKRPSSIKVTLKDRNDVVNEQVLSEANKKVDNENVWETTIENVDIYRQNGEKIKYTVDEVENEGTLESYIKTIEGMKIINTFTQNTEKTQVEVTKKWEDSDNKAGKRPENLVLILKKEVKVGEETEYQEVTRQTINGTDNKGNSENEWKYTFSNIAKYDENNDEIKYVVEEETPSFYETKIIETSENVYEITNTFKVPEEKINVEVTKVWNDNNNRAGKRPESVTLKLSGNGKEYTAILTKDNKTVDENIWKTTITDLPKYDENANIINYTLSEENLNNIFYTEANRQINQQSKTVTNRFEVPNEKVSIEVNKKWEDNNNELGKRPEEITLYLTGNNQDYEITLNESNKKAEDANIWSGTIENLSKYDVNGNEINYVLDERPISSEFYTKTRIDQVSKTVTNKFGVPTESIQIQVTKIWDDNNNKKGERPENIVLQIKKKGTQEVVVEQMVQGNRTTNEGWNYIFEVPKYDEEGNIVEYEIGEKELNNKFYPTEEVKINQEQKTITNVFKIPDERIEITVNKEWIDNEIQETRRPESVIFQVKGENGQEVARQEVNISNQVEGNKDKWKYTFTNLPRYNAEGDEIQYIVDELEKTSGELHFYEKNVTEVTNKEDANHKEATITNTFVKPNDKTSITVNKKWEDQEDKYGKRPEEIELQIKVGDITVKKATVNKEQNWQYTFTGLDKYDLNGQEIRYTADESELQGEAQIYYTKEISGTTITNRMTKTPGIVTVKYLDKYTNEEIETKLEKEGIIGESYDITEDKKDISGYTLVEEPEEKEGIFTTEPQEKIYYYAKNTEVKVKYLEKDKTEEDTDNKVVAKEEIISGYEGKEYTTEEKQIEGYTYIENKGNTEGKMTREPQEVIYYYAENTKVVVKYVEQDNTPGDDNDNKVLSTEEIQGYEGKQYTTKAKEIEGYTFVKATENVKGTMSKEEIQVIYYYAENTKVVVKYLEQDKTPDDDTDNKVLETAEIQGYEGKEYTTERKEIANYELVNYKGELSGIMTKEEKEVIYYYAQKTKVKVQHIDKKTGEILKEEIKEGKVGDICKTEAQDITGYVLVEKPDKQDIEMTKEEQIVKYYYAHISEGVIEKHIDEITGEILATEKYEGKEGDSYNTAEKEFEGYDIVKDKLPENAKGEMTKEAIEVRYYYIKQAKVKVEYLETGTDKKLAEETIINGHENEEYTTKAKEINGYILTKTPANATGKMKVTVNADGSINRETIVKYYYVKEAGGVVEKHIDIGSGKILEEKTHKGKVGDSYKIEAKNIEGYELVKEDEEGNSKLPENATGKMTEEKIEVIYYYKKLSTVKVEYVDKATGEKIKEEIIYGHEGEKYETEEKEIEGYVLVERAENAKGTMGKEEIKVRYYYQRKTEVEVKYIEKETGHEIAETEKIEGYVGKEYETKEKEVKYYKLKENTENVTGKMTKEKITVIYYYEKQVFNLEIATRISHVSINGIPQIAQSYENGEELYKIDIHRNKVLTAEVKVTYKIKVTNTGEIEGTASKIADIIPEGFRYNAEDNKIKWKEENGIYVTDELKEEIIKPGESKEIEITLRWINGENNFGEIRNIAVISGVTNPAKYADASEGDNNSKIRILMAIETGGLDSSDRTLVAIVTVQILILLAVGIMFGRKRQKNSRKNK